MPCCACSPPPFCAVRRRGGGGGELDIGLLLTFMRGSISENRMNLIGQAFRTLPLSADGDVDVNAVARVYTASQHPDVKAGRRNEADITSEFLASFKSRAPRSGRITLKDFEEYYKCVAVDARGCGRVDGHGKQFPHTVCTRAGVVHLVCVCE